MSWGYRITTVYLAFVAFMAGMVTLCVMQPDIFLVEKEYYKEEIHYQDKLNKLAETARLSQPLTMEAHNGSLTITYPAEARPTGGRLWIYRPNNANQDRHLPAQANEAGIQQVALAGLAPGRWRIKLDWQCQNRRYFQEKELTLPAVH
jgi:hypothetical protein